MLIIFLIGAAKECSVPRDRILLGLWASDSAITGIMHKNALECVILVEKNSQISWL